ncbi:MAG: ABC transporter permease [Bacteroidia bacterium]|nr:ABC transporter permease [Bacteroidia bacterium]
MGKFILNRILLIFPTLGVISLLAFFISINGPQDPVEGVLLQVIEGEELDKINKDIQHLLDEQNLDKPSFYFSILRFGGPDSLHKIIFRKERRSAEKFYYRHGHWKKINQFRSQLSSLRTQLLQEGNGEAYQILSSVLTSPDLTESQITKSFEVVGADLTKELKTEVEQLEVLSKEILSLKPEWYSFFPYPKWHGFDNRYHIWLSKAVRFDFGKSQVSKQPVTQNWGKFISMTLRFTLLAVILAYLLSILIGAWMALNEGKIQERFMNAVLVVIDAMPSFWLGTLLLIFLANPHYCDCFDASYLPGDPDFFRELASMVMPLITYTLGILVALSRLMKSSMLKVLGEDYIRTARAKGLSLPKVIVRHGLRNAIIPMLGSVASILVWMLSGSVVIERIFSIPGLGERIMIGVESGDVPVILTVFVFAGLFTALGYFLMDLLIMWADPRIRIGGKGE